jgi:hypothetical protein
MAAPSSTKLVLEPNVPQLIALKYPTGKMVESRFGDEKQVYFSLVDGRSAYFSLGVAQAINNLMLGTREPFFVCKRWNGSKQQAPRYDVWLTPEGEKQRAAQDMQPPIAAIPAEDPPSDLERQLEKSLAQIQARKNDANLATRRPPVTEYGNAGPVVTGQAQFSNNSTGPVPVPRAQTAPASLQAWAKSLLDQTNTLVDVYAQACEHASAQNVPPAVVRTVMLSAFIGLQRKGSY